MSKVLNDNGITMLERMNATKTAALLADTAVSDKKILHTLQSHLKYKGNGKPLFALKKNCASSPALFQTPLLLR